MDELILIVFKIYSECFLSNSLITMFYQNIVIIKKKTFLKFERWADVKERKINGIKERG